MRKLFLGLVSIIFSISATYVFAGELDVYGPKVIERGKGAPTIEKTAFNSPVKGKNFKIIIQNGDASGKSRVSSAEITLNGKRIVKQSDLNQKIDKIVRTASIDYENHLSVKLNSSPGGFVSITVVAPIMVKIDFPLPSDLIGKPETLVRGSIYSEAPYKRLFVNGERCVVNGERFFIDNFSLKEGENSLTIMAGDSSGNTVQAQTVIIHDTGLLPNGYVKLTAHSPISFLPSKVKITVDNKVTTKIVEKKLTCDGPADVVVRAVSDLEYELAINTAGVYTI